MIEIKEITYKDLTEDVLDILTEAFKHPQPLLAEAKIFMKLRLSKDIHTFTISLDGKVIGTASIFLELKLFSMDNPYVAHIEDLAIHQNYRGFGYGRKLINHLVNYAKENKCYKAILTCSNYNLKF